VGRYVQLGLTANAFGRQSSLQVLRCRLVLDHNEASSSSSTLRRVPLLVAIRGEGEGGHPARRIAPT
jgi:hypothetical protein